MSKERKREVIAFFRKPGVRVSVSRQTISRICGIAFPTLDIILAELVAENQLEANQFFSDMYKPTRQFKFYDIAEAAQRIAEDIAKREYARRAEFERNAEISRLALEYARDRKAAREKLRAERTENRKRNAAEKLAKVIAAEDAAKAVKAKRIELAKSMPLVIRKDTGAAVSQPDPWIKIRQRHYGKPPLVASNLIQLTPQELMAGRSRKRA